MGTPPVAPPVEGSGPVGNPPAAPPVEVVDPDIDLDPTPSAIADTAAGPDEVVDPATAGDPAAAVVPATEAPQLPVPISDDAMQPGTPILSPKAKSPLPGPGQTEPPVDDDLSSFSLTLAADDPSAVPMTQVTISSGEGTFPVTSTVTTTSSTEDGTTGTVEDEVVTLEVTCTPQRQALCQGRRGFLGSDPRLVVMCQNCT